MGTSLGRSAAQRLTIEGSTELPAGLLEHHDESQFFGDILLALRRHWLQITVAAVLGLAAGIAALLLVSPIYTAQASLVLDPRRPQMTDLPSIISEQSSLDITPQIRTEVQVIESDDLCRRVIQALGLTEDPQFLSGRSRWAEISDAGRKWLDGWLESLGLMRGVGRSTPIEGVALSIYRDSLDVAADGRSYVIALTFHAHDADLAAQILNKHAELYIADQVAYKRQVGKLASEWLSVEVDRLQERLRASQAAVQKFREENNIVLAGGTTLLSQRLAATNAELTPVTQERIALEAQLQHTRHLAQKGTIDSQSSVLKSPTIERLREQEATVLRKLGELNAVYGPEHPSIIKAGKELDDLRRGLAAEVGRMTKGLENDAAVARTREADLRQQLSTLERQTIVADRAEMKLHDLEREVTANRSLLETLLTRYKQVGAQEGAQVADARIIKEADVPSTPSWPRPRVVIPGGLALGSLIGMVLAFCRDLGAKGFRASREIETEFAVPSLGSLPALRRYGFRGARPEDCVIERPRSAFAEAIRYIRNSLQAVPRDIDTPRVFLVTSSLPNEGKTVLAVSLARSFARSGKRVLLIDCDLHNPSVGRLLGGSESSSDLTSLLSNCAAFDEVLQRDPKSPLDFIAARRMSVEPQDLLASRAITEVINYGAQHYDVVILDSPPVTAVADALGLARQADATILAVRWGETHRQIAKASMNKLFTSGARLCGAVLTQVDVRKGKFSPREPEYYQKINRAYYQG